MFSLKHGSAAPRRSIVALPPLSTVFSLILHMRISKATPTWVFQLLEEVRSMADAVLDLETNVLRHRASTAWATAPPGKPNFLGSFQFVKEERSQVAVQEAQENAMQWLQNLDRESLQTS